ncbi:nuclear transport factor 2 family protein [Streptomyces rhizosphaericus]|uniref:Nuclear transport factor 2 family protein n=1 Tax=Streptomyces rhizosphaericus TaxID=114699 RepID=A0A6G4AQ52_9ACTN|nr:nuclear transport factor 2 family protein [Streptomyces rhizosphaericus]NEW75368.1 nuclear transport factor 2 family protein [Streptomyces rhizosphaericus]
MASTTDCTRSVVEDYLRRAAEGDPERIAAIYAEKVDWMVAENPQVPWIRSRSARADVAGHWVDLASYTVPGQGTFSIDAIVVEGSEAVVMGHLSGTVRATGKTFSGPFALRLSVDDGLITRHHIYENSLSVAEACTVDGSCSQADSPGR